MIEIKLYGTGGQGVVVAAKLLADAAAKGGLFVQAFSAYGAERRGGKVESYVRLSEEPFSLHCKMAEPNYVVMMDDLFGRDPASASSIGKDAAVLINTQDVGESFPLLEGHMMVIVDAGGIAERHGVLLSNGMPVINTTILGAVVGMISGVEFTSLSEAISDGKIPSAEKNIRAAREAYDFVVSGSARAGKTGKARPSLVTRFPVRRDREAPCEAACPVGHAIRRTISCIRRGSFEEALENIRQENPFPGITGRVCFHPCELRCNAKELGENVAIYALERAAFDHADASRSLKNLVPETTGKKVAVIGSGPAGMTCAHYLALSGHGVTVFEASGLVGGIPRVGIPAYRLPKEIVDREMGEVIGMGVEVRTNTTVGKDISFDCMMEGYDACFIAVGAHRSVMLNIPGEDGEAVFSGLDFLKEVAFGNKAAPGRRIAVVGGGNTAVDAARTAHRLGAEEVTILYRRTAEEMPAYREEAAAALNEGVKIEYLIMPIRIHRDGERLRGVECLRTRLGERDPKGRSQPVPIDGSNITLEVDGLITATGETPDISFFPEGMARNGHLIRVDELGRTSLPGVYAGGDVTNTQWNVSQAIGSGKRAAIGIDLYLRNREEKEVIAAANTLRGGAVSMERYRSGENCLGKREPASIHDLRVHYLKRPPRVPVLEERTQGFDEARGSLSRTDAVEEAARCFHCGRCNLCGNCFIFCPDAAITVDESLSSLGVDGSLCKGCGICIQECPRDAMGWGGCDS